ncbi:MAG: glycosyltransferase family 9 protein [Cytophagaceae bacterium]
MKILVLRFSSIGDIVLTTPVVRCLKQQIPNAEVHVATKAAFANIWENNPYVDKIFKLEKSTSALIKQLKEEQYDEVIDLHNNLRTYRIAWALDKPVKRFNKLNIRKWIRVNWKWKILPKTHIVDRYLDTVKHLKVKNDHKGLDYFLAEKDIVSITEKFPEAFHSKYVAIALGAQHATKRIPEEKMIEIIGKIPYAVMLLGGKDDKDFGDTLVKKFPDRKDIINTAGQFSLNQSASLVQQCYYLVTPDTGLMHIGAAFKKRIIAVWGNTIPGFGMEPYLTEHVNWEVKNLYCRPCSKIGHNKCPKGHFRCMIEQEVKEKDLR